MKLDPQILTLAADSGDAGKPWWQSKTILGILILIISTAAQRTGLNLGDENITDLVLGGAQFGGAVFAIYGRLMARVPIKK